MEGERGGGGGGGNENNFGVEFFSRKTKVIRYCPVHRSSKKLSQKKRIFPRTVKKARSKSLKNGFGFLESSYPIFSPSFW